MGECERARELLLKALAEKRGAGESPTVADGTRRTIAEVLAATEAENPRLFEWHDEDAAFHIYWGGYDYPVEMAQLTTPAALLGWVSHLGRKGWELTTARRLAQFVEAVSRRRGWNIHGV